MAPLPPVRKRTDYSDIKRTDLVAALYRDKIMGAPDAMQPSALAGQYAEEQAAGTLKEADSTTRAGRICGV